MGSIVAEATEEFMSRLVLSKLCAFGLSVVIGATASAGSGTFSLDGDAQVVSGSKKNQNVVLLESDLTEDEVYGNIEWTPRVRGKNVLTLDELTNLSATYQVIAGGIGGGSPRFQISLDTNGNGQADGNLFVYIGDPPSFSSGTTGLVSTGNLLADDDLRFDATQVGGTFYMTFDEVVDLVGDAQVLGVDFVVDGGWMFENGQAVVVTQLQINGDKLNAKQLKAHGKGKGKGHGHDDDGDEDHGHGKGRNDD
jgi:hypothetical protein